MVRVSYLMYAAVGFMVSLILMYMESQFQWIAVGFMVAMILLGLFMKEKQIIEDENNTDLRSSKDDNADADNLNTPKEGNKNGI